MDGIRCVGFHPGFEVDLAHDAILFPTSALAQRKDPLWVGSSRPEAGIALSVKPPFNVKVRGAARLHRAAFAGP